MPAGMKNKKLLLKTLQTLVPKPTGIHNKITAVDVVRATMQFIADDKIWQYVSALGRSGTKKIAMCKSMPVIMDVVLLTVIRVLSTNLRESKTALSVYLKNIAARVAAKKHRAELNKVSHLTYGESK